MTKQLTAATKTTWGEACKVFRSGLIAGTAEFGRQYAEHIDAGFIPQDLHATIPSLSHDLWHRLEQIGRGNMAPELAWYSGPRQVLKLAPREYKHAVGQGGLDVLTKDGESLRRIPLDELEGADAQLVIRADGDLRNETAQRREWQRLRDMQKAAEARHQERKQSEGWTFFADGSGKINGTLFTRQQIGRMFREWQDVVI